MERLEKVIMCDEASIGRMFTANEKMIEMKNELGQLIRQKKNVGLLGFIVGSWFCGPVEIDGGEDEQTNHEL